MPRKGNFVKKEGKKAEEPKHDVSTRKDHKSAGSGFKRDHNREGDAATKGAGQIVANLGGFIFKCNGKTKMDCFKYRVLGLNEGKRKLVEQVRKGMRLFLFDVDLRLLYGIYSAASVGTYKLEPDAFNGQFPWQVRFSIHKDCLPLPEDVVKAALKQSDMDERKFKVELTTDQVHKLLKLFRPIPRASSRSPLWLRGSAQDQFDVSPRFIGSDRHRHSQLSSRLTYEPLHVPADRYMREKEGYDRSRTKYADVYRSEGRHVPYGTSSRLPRLDHKTVSAEDVDSSRHLQWSSRTKYESLYNDRFMPAKEGYDQSKTKYADLYQSKEQHIPDGTSFRLPRLDHKSISAADDRYVGQESRAQREMGITSDLSHKVPPVSLPPYSNDPVLSFSEFRLPREAEDLYSGYLNGRILGSSVAEVDPLYGHRLLPDLRGDVLDRRLAEVGPLVNSYLGGLSSEILRERVTLNDHYGVIHDGLPRIESRASLLPGGVSSASGLPYQSEILPYSRYHEL